MAGKKVFITLDVDDKGTATVKKFDKNTQDAFNRIKTNTKAATNSMETSFSKLKSHWVAYSVAAVAAIMAVKAVMTKVISTIKTWTQLSMVQEDAEIALAAALKANLDYTDQLNNRYQAFATSIQSVTRYGDEEVLTLMALIRNLGVSSDKVEEATKMAIGLATATNRDVKSMAQYIALAQQGEFTMLRRYIPALRKTNDATEQLRIVTEFAARGFKVAQKTTNSFSGGLKQMSNLWGDLREKLGSVITKNQTVLDLMKQTREWLIKMGEKVDAWREKNQALIDQKMEEYLDTTLNLLTGIAEAVKLVYKGYDKLIKLLKDNQAVLNLPLIGQIAIIKKALEKWGEYKRSVKEIGDQPDIITRKIETPAAAPGETPKTDTMKDYIKQAKEAAAILNAPPFDWEQWLPPAEIDTSMDDYIKQAKEMAAIEYAPPFDWEQWLPPTADTEKMTADQLNAYRLMYGDIKSLSWENYDLQVELLKKQRDELLAVTGDMATVTAWYAEKEKELILEKNQAILESTTSLTEAMSAAWENYIIQTKSDIEQLAELSIEIAQTIAQGIGDAFAQAIVYGKDLGKSFEALMKSTAATIISALIEIGVQRLIQWTMAQLFIVQEATSRMATLAAETYAGAFAATAAIPIIGPAMAPGVAAASTAAMLSGATAAGTAGGALGSGLAGVAHGGLDSVPRTGTYLLEKGEKVTPAAENTSDDEDTPILELQVNLDSRVLAKSFVHRTEIDSMILNRLRKALS